MSIACSVKHLLQRNPPSGPGPDRPEPYTAPLLRFASRYVRLHGGTALFRPTRLPVRSPSHHCGAWHCGTRRSYDSHSRVDSSYLHESGTCRVAFRSLGSDRHPTRARERLCAQHLTTDGTCIIENIGTSSRVHWPRHAVIGQRLISWCLIVRILSETHGHAALPPPPTSPSRRHISSSYTKSCLGHRYPALC